MLCHPLCRTHFSQYQASSAVPGVRDGDCYFMHRMWSGGWPYPKGWYSRLQKSYKQWKTITTYESPPPPLPQALGLNTVN